MPSRVTSTGSFLISFSTLSSERGVGRRDDHDRSRPSRAGAAGAADAVHIVVGVVRDVVVEDVADGGDVQAARGDVARPPGSSARPSGSRPASSCGSHWSRSPWIGAASRPCTFSDLATMSTSVLRLQKTRPVWTSSGPRSGARSAMRLALGSLIGMRTTKLGDVLAGGGEAPRPRSGPDRLQELGWSGG